MSLREEIFLRIPNGALDEIINKVREYYGYKDSDVTMIGSAHEIDIRKDERNKVLEKLADYYGVMK